MAVYEMTAIDPAKQAPNGGLSDIYLSRIANQPDLAITQITHSKTKGLREGDKTTLTATVSNLGDVGAASSKSTFVALEGSTLLGTVDTPAIPAGGSVEVSIGWDTAGVKGERHIVVTADSAGTIDESNEANNSATLTVTVQGNKLTNPSFEQSSNGTTPDNWSSSGPTTYESGGSDGAHSVSTGPGGIWTSDAVPIAAGSAYEASVASSGAGGTLIVQQLAADGTVLTSVAQPLLPTSVYAIANLHLTALAGAAQARVVLIGGLTGKTTFDGVGLFDA